MRLSKREKLLGGAILLLLIGLLVTRHGVFPIYGEISTRIGELQQARDTYEKYVKKMQQSDRIVARYYDIVGKERSSEAEAGKDPQKEFSEFVSDLCRKLGFAYPRIDPSKIEEIEGVDDYSFITMPVHTKGDLKSVSKLLKGFDREAILVRELDLRSRLDHPEIDLTITVARLVEMKAPEEKESKIDLKLKGKSATFRSRTLRKPLSGQ